MTNAPGGVSVDHTIDHMCYSLGSVFYTSRNNCCSLPRNFKGSPHPFYFFHTKPNGGILTGTPPPITGRRMQGV